MMRKKITYALSFSILCLILLGLFIFVPQVAHAQDLHTDLVYPGTAGGSTWVFTVWKTMLGIADVFVVLVLLMLAIVNILHINYDTYQIKKALPALIGGIIASNFSILICRMIVDVAQVLTSTFISNTQATVANYLCVVSFGQNIQNGVGAVATGIVSLLLIIVVGVLALIAVVIIAFLLFIRKVVIFLLVAIAPVAMILYAFPPTQGLFKQWWGQFIRWAFMGPIIMALIWVASQIGAATCGTFNLAAILSVIGISYLAAIIPFRLGGAVMGAWGKAGKGVSKYGWNRANRELEKRANWSPRTQWDAYKLRKASEEEQNKTLSAGKATKFQEEAYGLRSDADILAEKAVGAKQWKEGPGAFDMESRAELGRTVDNALHNNQTPLIKQVLLGAADKAMISDIMEEISGEAKIKLGYVNPQGNPIDKLNTDMDSQRDFVKLMTGGTRGADGKVAGGDLRFLNQVENAWENSGIHGSMSVFRDPDQNTFREIDEQKRIDNNRARGYSADPMRFVRNYRPDELLGADKQFKDFGIKLLRGGILSQQHLDLLADGYGRNAFYSKLNTPENHARLDQEIAAGGEGVEFLRGLKSALTQGAGHPPYTDTHAQQVNVGGQDLNVTGLGGAQDSPQVREEITSRMNRMNVQQANALAGNVGASGLPQDFKDLVGGINSLRQAVQQAGSLSAMGTTRAAADAAIQNIATTVGQQISKGMRGGMDPRRAVYDVLAASPQTERQHLLEAIQKGLSESEKVAQIGGHDADGAQLLEFYRQASDNGKIKDQSKLLVNWAGKLSEAHASPAEIRKGWQFIQAYNGVKPPEEAQGRGRRGGGRRGSQRDRRFEAEEE